MNDKEIIEQRKLIPVVEMVSAGKSKYKMYFIILII